MTTAQKPHPDSGAKRRPVAPDASLPARSAEPKIQLGARIAEAKYRRLKLAAVLRGATVQVLVEQAIEEFLTNHPELLQTSLVASPTQAAPRKNRPTR